MDNRIIRDIRYYEIKPDNYQGKFDGILGNIYENSRDTKYIGQRIARKLNELGFVSGEYDHIYICLSPKIPEDDIQVSEVFYDKRIKLFNYGMKPTYFNLLSEQVKDSIIKEITFKTLFFIYQNDDIQKHQINEVKNLIESLDKQIVIKYKTKETRDYRIDIGFQIKPEDEKSKMIIEYFNKKENNKLQGFVDLYDYEDIYYLIDTISLSDGCIVFQAKKSYRAEFATRNYSAPIKIEINRLKEI